MAFAKLILDWIEKNVGLPPSVAYASSCSGVDFFAAALEMSRPGNWTYLHAAEKLPAARKVLTEAWGITPDYIFREAASNETATAAPCDLYMASPDCKNFSRRKHGRDGAVVAAGAVEASNALAFIANGRAKVAIVENVSEEDGAQAIITILNATRDKYEWREQTLDAFEHGGFPVSRSR